MRSNVFCKWWRKRAFVEIDKSSVEQKGITSQMESSLQILCVDKDL